MLQLFCGKWQIALDDGGIKQHAWRQKTRTSGALPTMFGKLMLWDGFSSMQLSGLTGS